MIPLHTLLPWGRGWKDKQYMTGCYSVILCSAKRLFVNVIGVVQESTQNILAWLYLLLQELSLDSIARE